MFSRQDLLSERQVYRTTGSLVAWWGWAAFAVLILVVLALGHHDHAALVTAVVVIAITGIMYACALHPRIVASPADLTVVNPLRTHVVPWSAVTQVELVHNVRIHYQGPDGAAIVHSWAVQSSGRSQTRSELKARRAARRARPRPPGTPGSPARPRPPWPDRRPNSSRGSWTSGPGCSEPPPPRTRPPPAPGCAGPGAPSRRWRFRC